MVDCKIPTRANCGSEVVMYGDNNVVALYFGDEVAYMTPTEAKALRNQLGSAISNAERRNNDS